MASSIVLCLTTWPIGRTSSERLFRITFRYRSINRTDCAVRGDNLKRRLHDGNRKAPQHGEGYDLFNHVFHCAGALLFFQIVTTCHHLQSYRCSYIALVIQFCKYKTRARSCRVPSSSLLFFSLNLFAYFGFSNFFVV